MGLTYTRWILYISLFCIYLLAVGWLLYAITVTHEKRTHDLQSLLPIISQLKISSNNQQNVSFMMNKRKADLLMMCPKNSTYNLPNRHHLIYNKEKQILYCKATKAGSTFWGRLFLQIDKQRIASPFEIKPQIGVSNVLPSHDEWRHFDLILKKSKKFIIVRHPLERLYSGYVDKVFSPNRFYWDVIGKHVVKTFRKKSKTKCGHDVAFHEFLQYAAHAETTGANRDVHVLSLWKSCSPCHVKYDIIGKMETFKDDIFYILDKLNLKPYKDALRNISTDVVNDALYDTAQGYASMRSLATHCITKQNTAERIWIKLKARGFIAADLPVPEDMFYKNENRLFEIFKDAYSKSVRKLGRQGLKRQQHAIFLETIKRIPQQTIKKIADAYYMDFQMFGYDVKFDELWQRSRNTDFSHSAIFF